MKTNDLKKGRMIRLANGWFAIMADNQRGNIRMADVDGMYRETGSVYAHDIEFYRLDDETLVHTIEQSQMVDMFHEHEGEFKGYYVRVEHTDSQNKFRVKAKAFDKSFG